MSPISVFCGLSAYRLLSVAIFIKQIVCSEYRVNGKICPIIPTDDVNQDFAWEILFKFVLVVYESAMSFPPRIQVLSKKSK